jgi:two-component system KDP operon response regulator KdpE
MTTVLVADPDTTARRTTGAALRMHGYTVETARTLTQAESMLRRRRLEALIVDPGDDRPAEMIQAMRMGTDIPIIVVSVRDQQWDKVSLLDAGADDYLTKPFGFEELLARVRAALRRSVRLLADAPPIQTAHFFVHLADRRWIPADGPEVHLTPTEWKLVEALVSHRGHLVAHAELLHDVWGPQATDRPEYLRVHLASIRRKVEPEPGRPRYFVTAPGLGHRFDQSGGRRRFG